MRLSKLAAGIAFATVSAGALAGGPLYIHEETMMPYKWDTSKGSIPVWVDGGPMVKDGHGNMVEAFTFIEAGTRLAVDVVREDGTVIPKGEVLEDTVFLTVEQANAITTDAVAQWTNVETSTFAMDVRGSIASKTGIQDVNASNVDKIYGTENGYGFWVNYDTDGSILEEYFGIPRSMVLGIAFPEWADEETGEITEATALMNGWFVDVKDKDGSMVQGVFTHEFGHAINMSHSQANGHLAYLPSPWNPMYDGVPGCEGTNTYIGSKWEGSLAKASWLETMFPFINVRSDAGRQQGTVNVKDDIVNISDLYPTESYKKNFGSIKGTLYTKEGVEFPGINIVARNLDNPHYDVITQQSGNMTQGRVGPDGSFTINGLTPGGRYVVYLDTIKAGGYPTTPTEIVSVAEYWNEGESAHPLSDDACAVTEITVAGGETKEIEMHFNGYNDGIQYSPLVSAWVLDHAKNGKKALGVTQGGTPFMYDSTQNTFETLIDANGFAPLSTVNATMNKTATKAAVVADLDGNGIGQGAIWDIRSGKLSVLDDPSNNTCRIGSQQGLSSHSIWGIDDLGEVVVGNSRAPYSGGKECSEGEGSYGIPTVWNVKTGEAKLLTDGIEFIPSRWGSSLDVLIHGERTEAWIRADRVSGNGKVVTGSGNNNLTQLAWINGKLRDTYSEFGALYSSVISTDGEKVAFGTQQGFSRRAVGTGVKVWNTNTEEVTNLGGLRWCEDVPYTFRWFNFCEAPYNMTHEDIEPMAGLPLMSVLDANDDLSVITGRVLIGGQPAFASIYIEGIGWMTAGEFFGKQGVIESKNFMTNGIFGVSANGSEMMAGIVGLPIPVTIEVDANKAYVCENGKDVQLSFPKQVSEAVKKGAEFGRCEHVNDQY